jgi:hypothetical protein
MKYNLFRRQTILAGHPGFGEQTIPFKICHHPFSKAYSNSCDVKERII